MKLLFIGGINQGNLPRGGEEYKNQLLKSKIANSSFQAIIIDTYQWQKRPSTWFNLIYYIVFSQCGSVLISASSVSTYRLLKLINLIRPSLMAKTTYLVIGGYFPEGIRDKRFDWNVYQGLKNIIVEGEMLKDVLIANSNLKNIKVLPNFKEFPILEYNKSRSSEICRFVYVGRISKSKGIKEILDAVEIVRQNTSTKFLVDFFGPIDDHFDFTNAVTKYKGFLDFQGHPEKSYQTLSGYDCMLFPTYWMGEGFPGVLIDSFIAGLPVIVSDWNMNKELITSGVNGYIVEPQNALDLADKMIYALKNNVELAKMGSTNILKAEHYHIEKVWPRITDLL
jgi:glycosyltransferase involved in cell wall biosynthesis